MSMTNEEERTKAAVELMEKMKSSEFEEKTRIVWEIMKEDENLKNKFTKAVKELMEKADVEMEEAIETSLAAFTFILMKSGD